MFNKITFYNHREDYGNQLFYRGVFYVLNISQLPTYHMIFKCYEEPYHR